MDYPKYWYLRRLQLDQRLPDEAREALHERARLERWGHEAQIYRDAEDPTISIVLQGRVWLRSPELTRKIPLVSGDIFGRVLNGRDLAETATSSEELDAQPTLRAWDDTLLAVLERDEFSELVEPHLGRLSTRVGTFRKRRDLWVPVRPLLFTEPAERMAKVLLYLAREDGRRATSAIDEAGHAQFMLRLEARKLAALTGFNPARVREVLDALEVDNILRRAGADLMIEDIGLLRQIAGEVEENVAS